MPPPMYNRRQLFLRYLSWYRQASSGKGHGIHSPFVFSFIRDVLRDRTVYPEYERVENWRKQLLGDTTRLSLVDYGAGSVSGPQKERTVASLARTAAKPRRWGQLLYRMARYYQCRQIVELGTSLGITTTYLALAAGREGRVVTVEGAPALASRAAAHFREWELGQVRVLEGPFDGQLPAIQDAVPHPDLVFIDGNHRKDPTLHYFETFLPRSGEERILVFDDIHWSAGMEEAWEQIRRHPGVRCTIDLFFIGLVFFRTGFREQQHFSIRFS